MLEKKVLDRLINTDLNLRFTKKFGANPRQWIVIGDLI